VVCERSHRKYPKATARTGGMAMMVLGTKEVARMLGITPGAVRMMVYRGRLPARKLGRRIIFLKEELEEYLKALPPVVRRGGR